MIISIIVFLVSLSAVIMIHELGHFVMAKRAGILCHEFSLGMGPLLWSTKKGETVYSIRAIPIGGYVMMAGEEISDEVVKVGNKVGLIFDANNEVIKIVLDQNHKLYNEAEIVTVEEVDLKGKDMSPLYINEYNVKRDAMYVMKNQELQIAPYERGFDSKTIWQRFLAIFGGPFMNFVLALVVFLGISFITGVPEMDSAELGSVAEGYPAYGNLQEGDVIVSIEGESVDNWNDVSAILNDRLEDRNITFTVLRDGVTVTEQVTPILYFYSVGFHSDENAGVLTIIGDVPEDTKADAAGFQKGDRILTIDGENVASWTNVVDIMTRISNEAYDENRTVDFEMERGSETVTLTVDQPFSEAFLESQGVDVIDSYIGIGPVYGFDFFASVQNGFLELKASALLIFTTIQLLFDSSGAGAGIGVGSLAGPVGIFEITARALEQGLLTFFSWIGLLSVNLGVINLLPIPALDGGRLVFLGYEAVTRRKPNKRIENTLHYVMYLALMGLFVYITFNDILRLFNIR